MNTNFMSPFKSESYVKDGCWPKYPVHIEIHVTLQCNHRCIKCAQVVPKIEGKRTSKEAHERRIEIPFEKMKELLYDFRDVGVKAITYAGGGEPLMYQQFDEVLGITHSLGMESGIITNCNVDLTPSLLRQLSEVKWLRVSMDATNDEVYQKIHRPQDGGTYYRLIDNIQKLRQFPIDLGINYLIEEDNWRDCVLAVEIAKGLGVDYIRLAPYHTINKGKEYDPIWPELMKLFDEARKFQTGKFIVNANIDRFKNLKENPKTYSRCYYHELHPILGSDLRIWPCCVLNYISGAELGSFEDCKFSEAWNNPERRLKSHNIFAKGCPPCWFDKPNEFLEYAKSTDRSHVKFV